MADVTYEEEFHIELVLRNVINYIDPDEVPDLISAFAKSFEIKVASYLIQIH